MAITAGWLLVGDYLDLGARLLLSVLVVRCELNLARAGQLRRRSMRALSLLHHVEVVVEAGISVLDDESILHADGGGG